MAPSPGSRLSLTVENLQSLPKKAQSVETFVNEQRRNARFYATEALSIAQPPANAAVPSNPSSVHVKMPSASPLLKSRLEMQQDSRMELNATRLLKNPQPKELFKNFKHAIEDMTYESIKHTAVGRNKRPRSSDEDEEHSARLAERRERRRARNDIVRPKHRPTSLDESIAAYSDFETKRKGKKGIKDSEEPETELMIKKRKKGKAASGIALMETFTANNVTKARLTLQSQDSGKFFKQAKLGNTVKLGANEKENRGIVQKSSNPPGLKRKPVPKQATSKSKALQRKPIPTAQETVDSESVSNYDTESQKCDSPTSIKKRHTRAACIELNAGGDAHSDSWDIGSNLPSEDYSIRSPVIPHQPIESDGAGREPTQTSPTLSESIIATMTTPWSLDNPQSAFGRFTSLESQDLANAREHEMGGITPASNQDQPIQTRSRFFFSPLVAIPESMQSAVSNTKQGDSLGSGVEHDGRPQHPMSYLPPEPVTVRESVCQEEQSRGVMFPREPSPVDSLDILLREHDFDEALYGHTFIPDAKTRYNAEEFSIPAYEGEYAQQYDMESTHDDYQYEKDVELALDYDKKRDVIWEEQDADIESNHQPVFHQDQYVDEIDTGLVSHPPVDMYGKIIAQSREPLEGKTMWVDEANGSEYLQYEDLTNSGDEADVLPFAVGRTLLMGLEKGVQMPSYSTRVGRSSEYGQSVQEIEVTAARHLQHHW